MTEPNANLNAGTDPAAASRYPIALTIGLSLLMLPLCGSCLAAPFLVPLLQACLIIPMLPAALFGLVGGWRQSWWITLGLTFAALTALVIHDVCTNPYGYSVIYDIYIRRQPPPVRLMYFHSWVHLFDVTILLVCPAVATTTHALIERRRKSRQTQGARCQGCGYQLRGLSECRCPSVAGRSTQSESTKRSDCSTDRLTSDLCYTPPR